MEIKSRDIERARQQQAQDGVTLGMAEKEEDMKSGMGENHLWMCAV